MALAGEVKDLSTTETRDVTFPSDGFQMKGYLARPKAPGSHPAVIVLHEAFGLVDAQLARDFNAAADFVRAQPGSNGKVGCVGFCVGGRWTLLFACSSDKVNAAVDCWGGFINRATPEAVTTPERPTPVIDLVPQLHCPLYVVCGEEDQNPSPAVAEELRGRLEKAGKKFQFDMFKNAGHAFFADYRPSYREKAAFELWPKMVAFFQANLK